MVDGYLPEAVGKALSLELGLWPRPRETRLFCWLSIYTELLTVMPDNASSRVSNLRHSLSCENPGFRELSRNAATSAGSRTAIDFIAAG